MDYFKEEKRKLILVFILVLVSGILGIFIPPFLIGKAVDALYPGGRQCGVSETENYH